MLKELMESIGEIDRLVDHWRVEGAKMSKNELRTAIGHELEMLEYSPDQVKAVLPQIMVRLSGK
jgi:hypothetical protein